MPACFVMEKYQMRIMGLDFGSKTTGVAVSDPLGLTAQGLETIVRKDENKLRQTCARIEELIEEYGRYGVHIIPQGELESWFSADQPIGKNDIGKMLESISNDEIELENLHRFMERVFQSK